MQCSSGPVWQAAVSGWGGALSLQRHRLPAGGAVVTGERQYGERFPLTTLLLDHGRYVTLNGSHVGLGGRGGSDCLCFEGFILCL